MGRTAIDRTGQTFGKLTVIGVDRIASSVRYWTCLCSCGNTRVVQGPRLTSGAIIDCGKHKVKPLCHCEEPAVAKGLCRTHYNQSRKPSKREREPKSAGTLGASTRQLSPLDWAIELRDQPFRQRQTKPHRHAERIRWSFTLPNGTSCVAMWLWQENGQQWASTSKGVRYRVSKATSHA